MAADRRKKGNRKRAAKARHPPVTDTPYTDAELNARVRDFPSVSGVWDPDISSSLLLNKTQAIYINAYGLEGEDRKIRIGFRFIRIKNDIIHPTLVTLSAHLLLRKYKTCVTIKRLGISTAGDRAKEGLYGWSLSDYEKRRSVALLEMLYGSSAIKFRDEACALYYQSYGESLSRDASPRRGRQRIDANEELLQQLLQECRIFPMLRRALGDAESAASEWPVILSGKYDPSLNRLHRIMNPRQAGTAEMSDHELFATSIIVSFFGCTNAALVYPKLIPLEDAFRIVCFLGHVNLGKIGPSAVEAEAFLKYCGVERDETMPAAFDNIFSAVDKLCGWTKFRSVLTETCRDVIQAASVGYRCPTRFGRLWPMI